MCGIFHKYIINEEEKMTITAKMICCAESLKSRNYLYVQIFHLPIIIKSEYSADVLKKEFDKLFIDLHDYTEIYLTSNITNNNEFSQLFPTEENSTTYLCDLYFLDNAPEKTNISSNPHNTAEIILKHCSALHFTVLCFKEPQILSVPIKK